MPSPAVPLAPKIAMVSCVAVAPAKAAIELSFSASVIAPAMYSNANSTNGTRRIVLRRGNFMNGGY